jgi:DNA-binding NtrC family response regulator
MLRVLVIEPGLASAEAIVRLLRLDGHHPVRASTPREALNHLAGRLPFDAVLAQHDPRNDDTESVLRAARGACPTGCIVALHGWQRDEAAARSVGACTAFPTPFNYSALRDLIASCRQRSNHRCLARGE